MKIVYSSKFVRTYKKLPRELKDKAKKNELIFRNDPFDKRLKTHKLNGSLDGFWSFSIDSKNRIIFEVGENDIYYFHQAGSHNIYE